MRLRKKPWIGAALEEYSDFVIKPTDGLKGKWNEVFPRPAPLHVELGGGKGRFLTTMATANPGLNFVGIEAKQDVLYIAAKKVRAEQISNIRLLVFNVNQLLELFAEAEIDQLYINFCDPWPKERHAKRRLTHKRFLDSYRQVIRPGGKLIFKTDNVPLFTFSLEEFTANGLTPEQVTFDLHGSECAGNVMTEYEAKFSALGMKICRCEVTFSS